MEESAHVSTHVSAHVSAHAHARDRDREPLRGAMWHPSGATRNCKAHAALYNNMLFTRDKPKKFKLHRKQSGL